MLVCIRAAKKSTHVIFFLSYIYIYTFMYLVCVSAWYNTPYDWIGSMLQYVFFFFPLFFFLCVCFFLIFCFLLFNLLHNPDSATRARLFLAIRFCVSFIRNICVCYMWCMYVCILFRWLFFSLFLFFLFFFLFFALSKRFIMRFRNDVSFVRSFVRSFVSVTLFFFSLAFVRRVYVR